MSDTQREISTEYLDLFISSVKKGFPVLFVQESGALAVNHPSQGYIVLQLKDKVVDLSLKDDTTNGS